MTTPPPPAPPEPPASGPPGYGPPAYGPPGYGPPGYGPPGYGPPGYGPPGYGPPGYGPPPAYGPPAYGPPGYGPPGYGPPAQPTRRSHTLRNVLIIVGVLAVLCCGGAITGGVYLFKGVLANIKPAEDAANAFIIDLESNNYGGAYDLLCASTRASYPAASFVRVATAQPQISSHRITGAFVNTVNGRTSATVTALLRQASGASTTHIFILVKENGAWKVCGQPY